MKTLIFTILIIATVVVISRTAFASEISCSLTATSTNCATGTTAFVAFAPSASPVAGTYNAAQNISLSAANATSIRYTLDGTTPSCSSGVLYSAPISVKKTLTIRAISCYPNNISLSVSFQYLLTIFDARVENAVPTNSAVGAASLPTQTTSVTLSNTTKLDISTSVATSSSGQITINGASKILSAFTSGNLTSVDLSAPVAVGGQSVSVAKAVAIQSGVSNQPVILSNNDFSSVSVSIPDGASVLAPSGWDGTISPPKSAIGSGSAPSGFSLGGTILEIGSETEVLLFDKPVSVIVSGITGAVGYKSAGSSSWVKIANQCGGTYDSPSAPVFPGECAINNGTDTKIYTYHFTSFGSLDEVSSGSSSGSSNRGGNGPIGAVGGSAQASDVNGDKRVDILDFNLLLASWDARNDGPFYSGSDINRDGTIDIFDFTILLANFSQI